MDGKLLWIWRCHCSSIRLCLHTSHPPTTKPKTSFLFIMLPLSNFNWNVLAVISVNNVVLIGTIGWDYIRKCFHFNFVVCHWASKSHWFSDCAFFGVWVQMFHLAIRRLWYRMWWLVQWAGQWFIHFLFWYPIDHKTVKQSVYELLQTHPFGRRPANAEMLNHSIDSSVLSVWLSTNDPKNRHENANTHTHTHMNGNHFYRLLLPWEC